ncbi:unnamed protein product [Coregonus sp. 'balchen']|nr:unnamed protein product [Coregonus sp. 'balchen']
MPVQAAQWTEFLSCPICYNEFDSNGHKPISLGCSHTVCKTCLHKLHRKACPFDQTAISTDIDLLPLVEEEGRVRAVRAGRSLGERTVTELILQHQNPQQLSANLWAAVRARGCQFLGPATQEDALKLVLLALEDGLALSRKVLVLFVVQKLEARFPQASKTSIGHVTKRDEDSSLMQLKEEFRTYEALRREHDAQIVHIAMEAGLRISPEQWSSLLYGDLIHKSHMQSIIDKLQSPESFAKSVQELTIVLQRTGDPANLNSLRPHLKLLANIDHNPAPSWEELESVMLAVKPQANSKYKTSMCRDLRQQGGCPRGSNCTFAHTQDELETNRMRNKKISGVGRPYPLAQGSMGSGLSMEGDDSGEEACTGGLKGSDKGGSGSLTEVATHPQLIPRGGDMMENMKRERSVPNGSNGLTGSRRSSSGSMEHPFPTNLSPLNCNYYPSAIHHHKPCVARFLRSSHVPESSLPPSMAPPYSEQHPSLPPPREHAGPSPYGPPQVPQYGPLAPAHGGYAPLYDSRRMWRPQLYHREDARSNSLPPEVLHSSLYQPPLPRCPKPLCQGGHRPPLKH